MKDKLDSQKFSKDELDKFNSLSHDWWNMDGCFRTLHHINPARLDYIKKFTHLNNQHILDLGCGGGILAEALAIEGANVTGLDLASSSIEVAKLHLYESNLDVDYQCLDIGDYIGDKFDIISCMEMIEHVPNPEYIIKQCSNHLKPNGFLFLSTLNRNFKSYFLAVLMAEYVMNLIPKGTHDYQKFIKPSELKLMLNKYNLNIVDIKGINYNPYTKMAKISNNVDVNYIVCCQFLGV
jgi:2-polyprenyl-6-hydroxyphenyl methylase/3-demethylubiquinone-9 3-methyltransferase